MSNPEASALNEPVFYPAPEGTPASPDFALRVNGRAVFVYHSAFASFAYLSATGPVDVEVEAGFAFEKAVIRPLRHGIEPAADGRRLRFRVPGPMQLSLELDEEIRRPLFLFISPPEEEVPAPGEPGVIRFEAGKIHEAGEIRLESGQTLYIEGGAVVRGHVYAYEAKGIAIRGRGILDGGRFVDRREENLRLVHLAGCEDVLVEGITVFDSQRWTVVPAGCDRVRLRRLNILSSANSDDGIDLVGSRDVVVEDCFVRTKDDCVAIKAMSRFHPRGSEPIARLLIQRCVFWNAEWGNAIEIGYETRTERISEVIFRDCDIIRCEPERYGSGGAITIHNGDRAEICDILYENLRLEQVMEKLIDFKISEDRYSRDPERGQIRNITLRDIAVVDGPFPVSIIQGHSADHIPTGITVENLVILGERITGPGPARMVTEKLRDLRFV